MPKAIILVLLAATAVIAVMIFPTDAERLGWKVKSRILEAASAGRERLPLRTVAPPEATRVCIAPVYVIDQVEEVDLTPLKLDGDDGHWHLVFVTGQGLRAARIDRPSVDLWSGGSFCACPDAVITLGATRRPVLATFDTSPCLPAPTPSSGSN